MNRRSCLLFALMCVLGPGVAKLFGQSEASGWGNLRGIRVDDELVAFTTAVGIYNPDFTQLTLSQREGPTHTNLYSRDGDTVTVGVRLQYAGRGSGRSNGRDSGGPSNTPTTNPATVPSTVSAATNPTTNPAARRSRGFGGRGGLGAGIDYTLAYTDSAPGVCDVHVKLNSPTALATGGIYYFLTLRRADFVDASAQFVGGSNTTQTPLTTPDENGRFLAGRGTGLRITAGSKKTIEVDFPNALDVVVQQARGGDDAAIQIFFPLLVGNIAAGQTTEASFKLKVVGDPDTSPVTVTLDPSKTGRRFYGIGGNYRLQSRVDSVHIQYIFDHLRVAYGRVALPWNLWQPEENSPPPMLSAVPPGQTPAPNRRGGGMGSIVSAMEMAQTLSRKNIPMIISCWSPPQWATLQNGNGSGGIAGRAGQRLDPAKWDAMSESIGSYLVYLRDHYGAEPLLFSFNESNIGINVRQTPADHDEAIKRLGAHFKALGLKTKMLLGDTGDVPPISFIKLALNDPAAVPYIGAVSFHSWRGATDEQYQRWADASAKLGVALIDAEGGNDAQAYSYPSIFREEWYALDEAAEYVRIMRICQPQSILQWQFTENYSVLYIDGDGTIHPTQRFFNLKQMNLMPAGSTWVAVQSSSPTVLPAAFTDKATGTYTTHLVNNGASRVATINGLPETVSRLNVYVTDHARGMAKLAPIQVTNGSAQLTLPARSFITLINE